MQVAATTPHTALLLFAVCPDVAKLLAVLALLDSISCFTCLYFDCDVAEAVEAEYFF
jgi:hypothetical protein